MGALLCTPGTSWPWSFANPFGCAGPDDILGNHIAPSFIGCEYPVEGEETALGVDFDDPSNVAFGFHPATVENWRQFEDGSPTDGDQNMDLDIAGGLDDHVTWLATYVEHTGGGGEFQLCVGSDDGVQVWLNDQLLHSNNACRGRGVCQDIVPFSLEDSGIFCLRIAAWERGGGWGCSIGIQDEIGLPVIVGDDGDWIFHGTEKPEGFEGPCPDCTTAVIGLTCERNADGSVDVAWENPEGCTEDITVSAFGEEVATVGPDGTQVTIAAEDIEFDGVITVDNGGVSVARCSLIEANEFHTDQGFVSAWLHLGPFAQQDGASPGCDLMQMDHLTDGDITELDIEPVAGDEIETDYFPDGEAASLGLNPAPNCVECNLDGIPVWQEFLDIGDRFNVNSLVSAGDNQMSYGMFYIDVRADVTVDVGVASDDAIQVLAAEVGDEMLEIHCNSVARGGGGANTIQDLIPDVELTAGQWKFMVKVFEGGGGHDWRLQFQKAGQPIMPGEISLEPTDDPGGPITVPLKPGDVNGDSGFNIADMIALLSFLFGGGGVPACYTVPDTDPPVLNPTGVAILDHNGDGGVNIADAVAGLGGLFGGTGPHTLGEDCVDLAGACDPNCI